MATMLEELARTKQLLVYTCTWNMAGKPPPSDLTLLLQGEREAASANGGAWQPAHHLYAIGSEECERGILASMLVPGAEEKLAWEGALSRALGSSYYPVASQALGATHLVVFAHTALRNLVSDVKRGGVATGFANTLSNKGGVAVGLNVGATSLLFVNCHLAAGQGAVQRRNADWARIDACLGLVSSTLALEERIAAAAADAVWVEGPGEEEREREEEEDGEDDSASSVASGPEAAAAGAAAAPAAAAAAGGSSEGGPASLASTSALPRASQGYDRVVWMGDLNYRLGRGGKKSSPALEPSEGVLLPLPPAALPAWDRAAVDALLASGSTAELAAGDQLRFEQAAGRVAVGFSEGPLAFLPTYKLDKGSDMYDSGPKRRLPSYTDRILFKCREGTGGAGEAGAEAARTALAAQPGLYLRSYRAVTGLKSSDHRAVVGEFTCMLSGGQHRRRASSCAGISSEAAAAAAATLGSSGGRSSRAGSVAGGSSGGGGSGSAHLPPLPPMPIAERARASSIASAAVEAPPPAVALEPIPAALSAAASVPHPVQIPAAPIPPSAQAPPQAQPQAPPPPQTGFFALCFRLFAGLFSSSGKRSSAKVAPL